MIEVVVVMEEVVVVMEEVVVVVEEEGVGCVDKTGSNKHRLLKTQPLLEVENTHTLVLRLKQTLIEFPECLLCSLPSFIWAQARARLLTEISHVVGERDGRFLSRL